jgi:hypothetical protein
MLHTLIYIYVCVRVCVSYIYVCTSYIHIHTYTYIHRLDMLKRLESDLGSHKGPVLHLLQVCSSFVACEHMNTCCR